MPGNNDNLSSVMEIFEPLIQDGFISLKRDLSDALPIKILRDTVSSQSLLLTGTFPSSNVSYLGFNVLVKRVDYIGNFSILLQCKPFIWLQSWFPELLK